MFSIVIIILYWVYGKSFFSLQPFFINSDLHTCILGTDNASVHSSCSFPSKSVPSLCVFPRVSVTDRECLPIRVSVSKSRLCPQFVYLSQTRVSASRSCIYLSDRESVPSPCICLQIANLSPGPVSVSQIGNLSPVSVSIYIN